MIKVGDLLPDATLTTMDSVNSTAPGVCVASPKQIKVHDLTQGKNVVLFGLPGAFTPVCSSAHLPEFVNLADKIKEKGIDSIICISTNDAFVLNAWAKENKSSGKVLLVSDGNSEYVKKLGLGEDLSNKGMGLRYKRFAAIVRNGVIEHLAVDEKDLNQSSAKAILSILS